MKTDSEVAERFHSFEPSCLYPLGGGRRVMMVVRPGHAWQKHEAKAVQYEGKIERARVMPCGYFADGVFYEQAGLVLVVWHGTGPRAVAVLPKSAVAPAAAAAAAPPVARRSGWAPRRPPVPVPAGWPKRGLLPDWARHGSGL